MIQKWIDISCNNCDRQLSDTTGMDLSKARMIKWAKEQGWKIKSGKETYCFNCIETKKS